MPSGIASLEKLQAAFGELRHALDSQDAAQISAATAIVKAATDDVRSHGAWKMDADLRQKIEALKPMIESARVRVNLASDDARQRISRLAQNGAQGTPLTYGR